MHQFLQQINHDESIGGIIDEIVIKLNESYK
jgi:hypothetical protein